MSDKLIDTWADRRVVGVIHMLRDRKGDDIVAKCGKRAKDISRVTVWWGQVNCPDCRDLLAPTHPFPTKKKVLRKKK